MRKSESQERRTNSRKIMLEDFLNRYQRKLTNMWSEYEKLDFPGNEGAAIEQKEVVFDFLFDLLMSAYDEGLLIYPEINMKHADNLTSSFFSWAALKLKLVSKNEIAEMSNYLTEKIAMTIPNNLVISSFNLLEGYVVNLN